MDELYHQIQRVADTVRRTQGGEEREGRGREGREGRRGGKGEEGRREEKKRGRVRDVMRCTST